MLFLIEKRKNTIWIYTISKTIRKFDNCNNNNNGNSKLKPLKFIIFLLIIN